MPESFQLDFDSVDGIDHFVLHSQPQAPLVICLHGLGSSKESLLGGAVAFARAGLRVIGMDLPRHGHRSGAETRDAMLEIDYVGTMFGIVQQAVEDIARLIDHYGLASVALHGISLGGIVTFPAILADPRITVATIAMGSPDWAGLATLFGVDEHHPAYDRIAKYSPLTYADRMYPCAILMLHGTEDDVVPITGAKLLASALEPIYADAPGRFEFVAYRDLGHSYIEDMQQRSVEWTRRHL